MMKSEEKKQEFKKGAWEPKEDLILTKYIETHGEGKWTSISKRSVLSKVAEKTSDPNRFLESHSMKAGLMREGRSCRMRWKNYLRPNIKRGPMSVEEEDLIVRMHKLLGNRWSLIAGRIPGRSDNEIKNYWNTRLSKKMNNQSKTRSSTSKRRKLSQYSTSDQQTASESTHSSNKGSDKTITKKQEIILDHHQLEDKSWNSDPHSETAFYQEPVSPFMNSIMFDFSFELSVTSQIDNSPLYFMSDSDGYPFLL